MPTQTVPQKQSPEDALRSANMKFYAAFESLDLARQAIQPSRERRLQPIGAVGRQIGRDSRLDDRRARYAPPDRKLVDLLRQLGRKIYIEPDTHGGRLQFDTVAGIE